MSKKAVDWEAVYQEAVAAGKKAVEEFEVAPMVVTDGKNDYYVADGPCGFAWVNVPGNCAFGKFLKKEKNCRNAYPTGVDWWIFEYNQSLQKKEVFAYAAANALYKHGINARAGSRMD